MSSPQKLSMRKIFNAFTKIDDGLTKHLLFKDDLGVVIDAVSILSPFISETKGPYLIEDYRFIFCKKGNARTVVNLQNYIIEEGMMAVIRPGTIMEPISASRDFTVTGIGVSNDRMHFAFQQQMPDIFSMQSKNLILKVQEKERNLIEPLFVAMWNLSKEKVVQQETLNSMICVITRVFNDIFMSREKAFSANSNNRQHEIFQNFIALVNNHCRDERQLDFYADRLCITKRHLGTVIHEVSGITAKEWIDRAVITLAKVLLRQSNKSVAQISDELHFPTDSFFCKYFKRLTGITPLDWRKGE